MINEWLINENASINHKFEQKNNYKKESCNVGEKDKSKFDSF